MNVRWVVSLVAIAVLAAAGGLTWQQARERAALRARFIEHEHVQLERKAAEVDLALRQIYQGARTIALLPSIRAIQGRNLPKGYPDKFDRARFSADAQLTVQQVYNNLSSNVSVSEVYCILDGFRPEQGETPFFMFDELIIGREHDEAGGSEAEDADAPEESEDAEYAWYARLLPTMREQAPRFAYDHLDAIPVFASPVMRTCDNSQYLSRSMGDPHDADGMLFSVPFHGTDGAFKGLVSVIVRTNVFEAMLLDRPAVVVTPDDAERARREGWKVPDEPARFALQSSDGQVHVTDRRATSLLSRLQQDGDLVMHAELPLGPGAPYRLSYLVDESELTRLLRDSDLGYVWKLGLTLVLGLGLGLFARHWAQEQQRVSRIRHSMSTLTHASGEVAHIGRSLAQDSRRLNNGAAKQAASLQETSAALQELSSLARSNSDRMAQSRMAADRAQTLATSGRRALDQMIVTSTRAKQATEQTARVIHVIDEIAFQTNVLALNAAVEAARAGTAGMGFAVVAEEVRSLAMRCAESARDTQTLLDKARSLANENTASAESAAGTLSGVVDATQQIAQSFRDLSVASEEQATGVGELTRAIEQIETVTVATAQLAHSVSQASGTLNERADELEGVVQELGDLAHTQHTEPDDTQQEPLARVA